MNSQELKVQAQLMWDKYAHIREEWVSFECFLEAFINECTLPHCEE